MTPDCIRRLRAERCQLSLRALARALGVSYLSIWRYETGRRAIPMAYIVRLCTIALHMRPTVHPCPHCGGTGVKRS
jgi:transcriptional regulator with XRE-family HTH domain